MAGILTDYTAALFKEAALGVTSFTVPTSLKAAIYTSSAGIKTNVPTGEADYVGYARASISFNGSGQNTPISYLGPPTSITITHLGLIDETADKILWAAPLNTPKTLAIGEPLFFNVGGISISFDTIAA